MLAGLVDVDYARQSVKIPTKVRGNAVPHLAESSGIHFCTTKWTQLCPNSRGCVFNCLT